MSEVVALLDPTQIQPNPDNPRLIFHEAELQNLADSIAKQGILVPLTVYQEGKAYRILDGERRWRCARRLNIRKVPVIVQPKPDKMTNLMMMFAIHNARKDWDPLPTAIKLEELESEFRRRHGSAPSETELSGIASIPRGEVRRLKKLLALPKSYRKELMLELEKPRSAQVLTVDHVIEATAGVEALHKRKIVTDQQVEPLRRAIVDKFKSKVIDNTVAPRKLANLARAVERNEITISSARQSVKRLIEEPKYSIDSAYQETVERADLEHGVEQVAIRLTSKLDDLKERGILLSEKTSKVLAELIKAIRRHA